ncbi:MAG: sulfite exporter TauE/SafE family protein [Chloroflexi bacterium]|nr:sulfite exporter TauE/SafE family protein [Chloroflexota bacterium]
MGEISTVAVVGVAALVASTVAAVAGFGGAAIMLPILVGAFGVRDAIPILTVSQLIGNLSRVWFNKGELSLPVVKWFALGAVPAATIGGIVFATAPAGALTRVLGAFLLVTVAYRHTPWGNRLRIRLRGFLPLGATSGAISAMVGTVGPFMAPFFLAFGLVKGAYIGTEAMATVVMHVTKLGVYGSYALLGTYNVLVGVAIGAVMFVGSYLGKRILSRLPERLFPYLIEAVLIAAGLLFIVRGK